jgi:hypothetical protein
MLLCSIRISITFHMSSTRKHAYMVVKKKETYREVQYIAERCYS